MKRLTSGLMGGFLLLVFALGFLACDHTGGINDVEVWQKRLQEAKDTGDKDAIENAELAIKELTEHWVKMVKDASRREQSLKQLGHIKDPAIIPPLMNVWKDDPSSRRTIAKMLGDIGDPSAGKILLENLKDPKGSISEKSKTNGLNFTILTALGKMKYQPAKDKLIHFLKSDRPDVATAAAVGLGQLGVLDPKAVDGLKTILVKQGPNWMQAKKKAIVALGEMKATSALSELVLNLWQDNGNYYPAASDALFKMGEVAIPTIIQTLERKNQLVEKWLAEMRKRPNGMKLFPTGTIEAKCIEVLGDQESPKAAPAAFKILETLTNKLDKDGTITMVEGQMCGLAAMTIGRSRDKSYGKKVTKVMMAHKTQPAVIANFAMGLTILGDKASVPDLMKLAAEELDYSSTDSRAKSVLAVSRIADPAVTGKIKALMDKVGKQAIEASPKENKIKNTKEFKAFIEKMKKMQKDFMKIKDAKKKEAMIKLYNDSTPSFWLANFYTDMEKNLLRLDVAKQCGDKLACLDKEVNGKDMTRQDRAAWDLARSDDPKAVDALLKALNTAAKGRKAAVKPEDKYKYDSTRQSIMWALRLLAHNPKVAATMGPKIKAQVELETLNKTSMKQILVVVDHTIAKK